MKLKKAGGTRTRRIVLGTLAMTAVSAGTLAIGAGSAAADTLPNAGMIAPQSGQSLGLVLDVQGASLDPGAPVITYPAHAGANQDWQFAPDGSGAYRIVNINSTLCLTTDRTAGDGLFQDDCGPAFNDPGQHWIVTNTGSGYTFQNPASGLYIDIYGDNKFPNGTVDAWYYNGNENQVFNIYPNP